MKTTLVVLFLMGVMVTETGPVLAQYAPVPSYDPFVSQGLRKNREYQQKKDEEQSKSSKEQADVAKEADQRRGAEADSKLKEQKRATRRGINKKAHADNQKLMEARSSGKEAKPADMGMPNYSASPAVLLDRRIQIDPVYLKHYARPDYSISEPFWIAERDGALMLVDPHNSQNLR
jgi:hypothetical protein